MVIVLSLCVYYAFAEPEQKRVYLPMRYLMAIMGSIGMGIAYGFKANISVAVVAMVNHTALRSMEPPHLSNLSSNVSLICNFSDSEDTAVSLPQVIDAIKISV